MMSRIVVLSNQETFMLKIISPENISRFKESGNDFKSVLKHYLAIRSLPDGWYGLFDDGKQVSETVEIRNGKVRGERRHGKRKNKI